MVEELDFAVDESAWDRKTSNRERMDQLRDWTLMAVLGASGLPEDDLARILFDLPEIRHGHMRAIANFEFGQTRSRYIGDGCVVALLPKCSKVESVDYLAHIADEHRKTLGSKPKKLLVFNYQLDAAAQTGSVARQPDFDGGELFSKENGYFESEIRGQQSLISFLKQVEDITYANVEDDMLELGGRKLLGRKYRGLRLEDVAAIWQAQTKLYEEAGPFWDRVSSGFFSRPDLRPSRTSQLVRKGSDARVRRVLGRTRIGRKER